jgi:hypothetical protein
MTIATSQYRLDRGHRKTASAAVFGMTGKAISHQQWLDFMIKARGIS